jgi:hypothetical protein
VAAAPFAFRTVCAIAVILFGGLGANALGGLIGAPAIENVALGCARIGIGPEWVESLSGLMRAVRW